MTVYVHLVNEVPVRLWGLSSRERVRRLLRTKGDFTLLDDLAKLPPSASVLLLRGDYLFDPRVLEALAVSDNTLLKLTTGARPLVVAARVPARLARPARDSLEAGGDSAAISEGITAVTPDVLCPAFQEQLLKSAPPFVLPITLESRSALERLLFGAAYKGITDLVTKWVWPIPAEWGVRLCVRLRLRPNHVTTLSWLLAVAAGWMFATGHFAAGLAVGWFMTYLDTVDGKLARVTVTSSKGGHLFDHILDLAHPPLWYLAWGLGLESYQPLLLPESLNLAFWLIFAGYVVGRLAEGAFLLWLGRFGIFSWRKIDSYSRLITARRNPCLILLTLGASAGRPDLGLEAVAVWTLLSTLFLLVRLAMASVRRLTAGPLTSWLADLEQAPRDRSLAVRWFARRHQEPLPGQPR